MVAGPAITKIGSYHWKPARGKYLTEVQGECGQADTLTKDLWLPEVGGFVSVVFRLCHSYMIQLHLCIYRGQKSFKGNQINQTIDFNWESLNRVLEANTYSWKILERV